MELNLVDISKIIYNDEIADFQWSFVVASAGIWTVKDFVAISNGKEENISFGINYLHCLR